MDGCVQTKAAGDDLDAVKVRCDEAAAAAQNATDEVQEAESTLADARRAADAVQVMLQAKQAQGLQTQAQELEGMAQTHENEVHRYAPSRAVAASGKLRVLVLRSTHMLQRCTALVNDMPKLPQNPNH